MTQYMKRRFATRSNTCERCKSTNLGINNQEYVCFKCGNKGLIEAKPHYAQDDVHMVTVGNKQRTDKDEEPVPFACAVCKSKKPKPEWVMMGDITFCSSTCMARRHR